MGEDKSSGKPHKGKKDRFDKGRGGFGGGKRKRGDMGRAEWRYDVISVSRTTSGS